MTNLNGLQKQYDKLTPRERFALVVAAVARDDKSTRAALMGSAPRKTWEVPHTWGIAQGFLALTDFHLINQLGAAGTIWLVTHWHDDESMQQYTDPESGEQINLTQVLMLTVRRFIAGVEAYKAICEEYKVDPAAFDGMTAYHIYDMLLAFTEITARHFVEALQMEIPELEETKQAYREILERHIKDWS